MAKRSATKKELTPVYPETDIENTAHPAIGVEDSAAKNINDKHLNN